MKSFPYIPELDGVRSIAIVLVLLTHANFQLAAYGYLGVQVFFTLSGFLITSILLNEKSAGKVSINRFYIRRAFRLLPALFLFLIFIQGYNLIFESGDGRKAIQGEIWASLFYVYNLSWLWNDGKLITHMWSLAIEEQFYLIWPWIIIFLGSKKYFPWILTTFIIISALIKIIWSFDVWNSIMQESLIIGCLAAVFNQTTKILIPKWVNYILLLILAFGGIFLPYGSISIGFFLPWVVGLIAAFPIISFANGQENEILSSPILVYLGKLSYSLYLWHVPIFKWFKWYSPLEPWQSFILKFMVTFLVAMVSYHLIERPLIQYGKSNFK